MSTGIEWTDETWNPTRGCSRVSPGCVNCYAERTAMRQIHDGYRGLVHIANGHPAWTGAVRAMTGKTLEAPLRWKKPRRIFVNSMSDLFHESLPDEAIDRVFAVMAMCPQHTFQVLTKRADRMLKYWKDPVYRREGWCDALRDDRIWAGAWGDPKRAYLGNPSRAGFAEGLALGWRSLQLPNVWLGVSVENQQYADERIPLLLNTPAAIRFVSYEPALGPVDFNKLELLCKTWRKGFTIGRYLDWIIVGGESGPGARAFDIDWARTVVEQCKYSETACFVKQLGADPYDSRKWIEGNNLGWKLELRARKGDDMDEWPADLRVREFPR